jgi:uncharacterized protein YqeY
MSLKEKIMSDVKEAMKAKQAEKLAVLRFVHAAIKNKEIEIRPSQLSEEDTMNVLKKLVKQRKESINHYEEAGRSDLVDKEKFELDVIETYLPEPMGEAEVKAIVDEAVAATGARSMKDMGRVMQAVREKTAGNADNKLVSDLVKSKLQ